MDCRTLIYPLALLYFADGYPSEGLHYETDKLAPKPPQTPTTNFNKQPSHTGSDAVYDANNSSYGETSPHGRSSNNHDSSPYGGNSPYGGTPFDGKSPHDGSPYGGSYSDFSRRGNISYEESTYSSLHSNTTSFRSNDKPFDNIFKVLKKYVLVKHGDGSTNQTNSII